MAVRGTMTAAERERLRVEWMERSARAFEGMFAEDQQAGLVTFTQRECRAVDLGEELAKWLLEEHVAADPSAQQSGQAGAAGVWLARCPKCGKAGVLVTGEGEPLPGRKVLSLAGEVGLEREQYQCTTCRVVFFPLGPEAGVGGGGVQPAGATEGGAPGGQGGQLRRRRG
jgi:hypothetical protein